MEDTVVLCPSGARLHRMFYRVLRPVHTVVTPGRFVPLNPVHELPKVSVPSENLRQAEREDDYQPCKKFRLLSTAFSTKKTCVKLLSLTVPIILTATMKSSHVTLSQKNVY